MLCKGRLQNVPITMNVVNIYMHRIVSSIPRCYTKLVASQSVCCMCACVCCVVCVLCVCVIVCVVCDCVIVCVCVWCVLCASRILFIIDHVNEVCSLDDVIVSEYHVEGDVLIGIRKEDAGERMGADNKQILNITLKANLIPYNLREIPHHTTPHPIPPHHTKCTWENDGAVHVGEEEKHGGGYWHVHHLLTLCVAPIEKATLDVRFRDNILDGVSVS